MNNVIEYKDIIFNNEDVVLDVRTKEEFNNNHVENTPIINIALDSLENSTNLLTKYNNIYIMCARGPRAESAYKLLLNKGFSNIYVIKNGMNGLVKNKKFSLQQQLFIVVGILLLIFSAGILYSNFTIFGVIFIAFGLIFAGLTNKCLMLKILLKLPYNK